MNWTQEEFCRKKVSQQKEEMRKIKEEIDWKEGRFCLLSDKVDKNRMADAEMEAELQGLQAGEERKGSNASQTWDSCLEALWQQIAVVCAALGPNQVDALANAVLQRFKQFRSRCQEKMKEEGIVKMNKSKVEPVSKWRCPRQAGSIKLHQQFGA